MLLINSYLSFAAILYVLWNALQSTEYRAGFFLVLVDILDDIDRQVLVKVVKVELSYSGVALGQKDASTIALSENRT